LKLTMAEYGEEMPAAIHPCLDGSWVFSVPRLAVDDEISITKDGRLLLNGKEIARWTSTG